MSDVEWKTLNRKAIGFMQQFFDDIIYIMYHISVGVFTVEET